jgi:hypothetical protein
MPFDIADTLSAPAFAASALIDLSGFEAAAPTVDEALANPDAALAFLFLAPQPCAALDALLAA